MPYILQQSGDKMSAAQVGYWSVRWSFDVAKGLVAGLIKEKGAPGSLTEQIRQQPFAAEMQCMALTGAAYWICATVLAKAPPSVMQDLRKGQTDGIKDCCDPSGRPYDADLKNIFNHCFGAYFDAMKQDFISPPDSEALIQDGSRAGQAFVSYLTKIYQVAPNVLSASEHLIGLDATSAVDGVFTQMMKESRLVYKD